MVLFLRSSIAIVTSFSLSLTLYSQLDLDLNRRQTYGITKVAPFDKQALALTPAVQDHLPILSKGHQYFLIETRDFTRRAFGQGSVLAALHAVTGHFTPVRAQSGMPTAKASHQAYYRSVRKPIPFQMGTPTTKKSMQVVMGILQRYVQRIRTISNATDSVRTIASLQSEMIQIQKETWSDLATASQDNAWTTLFKSPYSPMAFESFMLESLPRVAGQWGWLAVCISAISMTDIKGNLLSSFWIPQFFEILTIEKPDIGNSLTNALLRQNVRVSQHVNLAGTGPVLAGSGPIPATALYQTIFQWKDADSGTIGKLIRQGNLISQNSMNWAFNVPYLLTQLRQGRNASDIAMQVTMIAYASDIGYTLWKSGRGLEGLAAEIDRRSKMLTDRHEATHLLSMADPSELRDILEAIPDQGTAEDYARVKNSYSVLYEEGGLLGELTYAEPIDAITSLITQTYSLPGQPPRTGPHAGGAKILQEKLLQLALTIKNPLTLTLDAKDRVSLHDQALIQLPMWAKADRAVSREMMTQQLWQNYQFHRAALRRQFQPKPPIRNPSKGQGIQRSDSLRAA